MNFDVIDDIINELIDTDSELNWVCTMYGVNEHSLTEDELDYLYSQITRCEECGEWFYTEGGECCKVVYIEELD